MMQVVRRFQHIPRSQEADGPLAAAFTEQRLFKPMCVVRVIVTRIESVSWTNPVSLERHHWRWTKALGQSKGIIRKLDYKTNPQFLIFACVARWLFSCISWWMKHLFAGDTLTVLTEWSWEASKLRGQISLQVDWDPQASSSSAFSTQQLGMSLPNFFNWGKAWVMSSLEK